MRREKDLTRIEVPEIDDGQLGCAGLAWFPYSGFTLLRPSLPFSFFVSIFVWRCHNVTQHELKKKEARALPSQMEFFSTVSFFPVSKHVENCRAVRQTRPFVECADAKILVERN